MAMMLPNDPSIMDDLDWCVNCKKRRGTGWCDLCALIRTEATEGIIMTDTPPHCPSCDKPIIRIAKGAVDYFIFDDEEGTYRTVGAHDPVVQPNPFDVAFASATKFWCEYCHYEITEPELIKYFYEHWDRLIAFKQGLIK